MRDIALEAVTRQADRLSGDEKENFINKTVNELARLEYNKRFDNAGMLAAMLGSPDIGVNETALAVMKDKYQRLIRRNGPQSLTDTLEDQIGPTSNGMELFAGYVSGRRP